MLLPTKNLYTIFKVQILRPDQTRQSNLYNDVPFQEIVLCLITDTETRGNYYSCRLHFFRSNKGQISVTCSSVQQVQFVLLSWSCNIATGF
jgi:hypothetical protein